MIYKLLAPVLTDFFLVTEFPIRERAAYVDVWNSAQKEVGSFLQSQRSANPSSIHASDVWFAHREACRKDSFNRYRLLKTDSLESPLHVVEVHIDTPSLLQSTAHHKSKYKALPVEQVDRVYCRVFDHGITLLEIDFQLGDRILKLPKSERIDFLNFLQSEGIEFGARVADVVNRQCLQPLFDWLTQHANRDRKVIDDCISHVAEKERGKPLWVTRSLILEEDDRPVAEEVIRHWLKDSGGEDLEEKISVIDQVIKDSSRSLTHWLNYLFREDTYQDPRPQPDQKTGLIPMFCDQWEAVVYCQYFYSAMERVDVQQTQILADAFAHASKQEIADLKNRLETNMKNASLLLLQYYDNAKYYKLAVSKAMNGIMDYWQFEKVLIEPVQKKIKLCQERLRALHEKESKNSAFYTDIILISIGITSIFGIFLSLAQYGRTIAADAELSSYDVEGSNIIDLFAGTSTDIILIASLVVSLFFVASYIHFRQRQTI